MWLADRGLWTKHLGTERTSPKDTFRPAKSGLFIKHVCSCHWACIQMKKSFTCVTFQSHLFGKAKKKNIKNNPKELNTWAWTWPVCRVTLPKHQPPHNTCCLVQLLRQKYLPSWVGIETRLTLSTKVCWRWRQRSQSRANRHRRRSSFPARWRSYWSDSGTASRHRAPGTDSCWVGSMAARDCHSAMHHPRTIRRAVTRSRTLELKEKWIRIIYCMLIWKNLVFKIC